LTRLRRRCDAAGTLLSKQCPLIGCAVLAHRKCASEPTGTYSRRPRRPTCTSAAAVIVSPSFEALLAKHSRRSQGRVRNVERSDGVEVVAAAGGQRVRALAVHARRVLQGALFRL